MISERDCIRVFNRNGVNKLAMSPCYCNLFFSFVVVLFFASVASIYLCPENFCPEKNQVCFNFRCLKSCPATTYVYNKNCVKNCPNGLFSNGKECVIHCPLEKPLIQDGHCQSYCTFGRVLNNGTCAIGCPIDTFLYTNSCVDVCPNTHNLTLNSTIVAWNKNHQVVTNYALTCVNECPETTVKTTNSCLLQCPERMILFNRSCVHNCPSSHPIVLIRSSTLNSIPTCVEKCPLNQFIFIKTCVPHCPPDTLIRNGTCVKNCSHPFPFLCERGKCTNDLIDNNTNSRGQCLSTCPKKHTLLQKNCFQYCYLSPWRYRLNDTCVSECPANLTYLDIHKPDEECVNMCPNGTVQLENECRTRCPLNMIPLKGKCYTECPEMYPYRHETYHYPYIRNLKEIACVKSCPPGTFHYKKQCLQNCPNEAPAVQNRTCMKNCTDQFPLTCTRNKCFFSPYPNGAVQCLTKCPPNHKRYGQECFRHCYDTPLKYLENGTCVYGCSKNLSIGIEKQCVDSCLGRYKYMYQDSCVENCPENTFSFNKVCYVSCPPEYPNRYVYKTGVWKVVTHITCRKLCPHGTVSYNRTCETHCPTGWFIFNSSCVEQCPSSNPFHYTMFGSVNKYRCVSERPKYALELNNSFYNRCPDAVKFIFNGTCFSNCPENYPYSQLVSLNDKIATECVHVCKDNTVLWNQTCVPNCPSGLLVYKEECVSSCPKDASVIYEANRKFMESPMSQALTEEASLFCSRYCKRVDGFENLIAPCIYQGQNGYHLLERICQHMEHSKSFESIVQNCITLPLFERNGTFFDHCPNQFKQTRRACVDECPSSEPFYDSNLRRCMTRCAEKQFTHKNDCVKECPRKTLIINSVCMDIEKCPSDTPLFLAGMDGNRCVKRCPDSYFLDGNACVKTCRGKMILDKTCTINCTKTHPFVKIDHSVYDISECFQVCPGDYIGNVTSLECIYKYDCKGFVFNKRCFTKCPDHTITVINWNNGNSKMCRPRLYLQIELLIYFLIALVFVLPSILCMCVEKGTPTKCLHRFQSYIDQHSKSQGTMDDETEFLFDSDALVDDQIQSEVAVEDIIERCSEETSQQND